MASSLPAGVTPARTSVIPTLAATVAAAPGLSPVNSTGVNPSLRNRVIASALDCLIESPTTNTPRTAPSQPTTTAVLPAASATSNEARKAADSANDQSLSIQCARPTTTARSPTVAATPLPWWEANDDAAGRSIPLASAAATIA